MALFVYTGMLTVIFLFALLFSEWFSITLSDFFPDRSVEKEKILLLSGVALVLNSIGLFASILIWRLKKTGLFLFTLSSLLFLVLPFLFGYGSLYSLAILSFVLVLLFLHYGRFQ
jgi:hypothetical protein